VFIGSDASVCEICFPFISYKPTSTVPKSTRRVEPILQGTWQICILNGTKFLHAASYEIVDVEGWQLMFFWQPN
jgi:hypothetical protein